MRIGDVIRKYRKESGMTQEEMANRLGVTTPAVNKWEKNATRTAEIMQAILDSLETIGDFTKSRLYQHMTFKPVGPEFADGLRSELLQSLEDESYSYMQGNESWEKLKASATPRC